jgi:DNA repair exonuclease SbcCD ATPase subunit
MNKLSNEKILDIPEDISKFGTELTKKFWKYTDNIIQTTKDEARLKVEQADISFSHKNKLYLEDIEQLNKKVAELKQKKDLLTRENKSLSSDLDHKSGELQSSLSNITQLEEKILAYELEIKHIIEEKGRAFQQSENTQKRLDEVTRLSKQDHEELRKIREKLSVSQHSQERVEKHIVSVNNEMEQQRKVIAIIQSNLTIANTSLDEKKQSLKNSLLEVKNLKAEMLEYKEAINTERNNSVEIEKQNIVLETRLETRESIHIEIIKKIEHELFIARAESLNIRNRIVKTEGALERERKAVERLETKLIVVNERR